MTTHTGSGEHPPPDPSPQHPSLLPHAPGGDVAGRAPASPPPRRAALSPATAAIFDDLATERDRVETIRYGGRSSSTGVVDVVVEVIRSGPRQSVADPQITPVTQSPGRSCLSDVVVWP